MSTRAMVFIDGTWLAFTANRLADQHGIQGRTGGPLDFGALPRVCAQEVTAQMAVSLGLDVVRTHYFGSIATNFDTVDQDAVQRRSEFFDSLRRHHRYEVYRFETDYRGHRVRRTPGDEGFSPPEKAVDVGLATALLEMAAVSAYDIAIVVCGDRDFVPALQAVRRLGKRVAIVSARGSCAREFSDPNDPMRVRDFDTLWLDSLWTQVVSPLARPTSRTADETQQDAVAESPVPTADDSDDPIADSPYAEERQVTKSRQPVGTTATPAAAPVTSAAEVATGTVTKVHANGYGFVRSEEGADFYFRRTDFSDPSEFARLERFRTRLTFRISEAARSGQAGRATALVISGVSETPMPTPVRQATHHSASPTAATASANAAMSAQASPRVATPSHAGSASAAVATGSAADELWAMDPFAAPPRRESPTIASGAEVITPIAPEGEVVTTTPLLEAPLAASLEILPDPVHEPVGGAGSGSAVPPLEVPRKKRASKKTLSA